MSRATKVLGMVESSMRVSDDIEIHEAEYVVKHLVDLRNLKQAQIQIIDNIFTAASKQSFFVPSASEAEDNKQQKIIKDNLALLRKFIKWAENIT